MVPDNLLLCHSATFIPIFPLVPTYSFLLKTIFIIPAAPGVDRSSYMRWIAKDTNYIKLVDDNIYNVDEIKL